MKCTKRAVAWLGGVLLFSSAAVVAGAAGEYRTLEVESLRIEFDSEWAMRTSPGYVPIRFDITNVGGARVIELVGQGSRFFRGGRSSTIGASEIEQRVRLARGDRVRLTIPVPVFATNENIRFEIRENGRTLERLNFSGFEGASLPGDASALIVADRTTAAGAITASWVRPLSAVAGSSGYFVPSLGHVVTGHAVIGRSGSPVPLGSTPPPMDFVLPPSRLPTDWLGYTSLRAVIIGPPEWEQLNEAQKSALRTWTACGGDLVFVDGDLSALFPPGSPALTSAGDRSPRAYFFGRIHRPTAASVAATGLVSLLAEAQKMQDSSWALPANGARDWGAIAARGFRLPIPGITGVPARTYVSILIAFSLIIGPVNYWFLRRHQQQVLLVLTAPLISAIFIVLLAAYVVAGEGLGVRGRAASFTILDQLRNQAVTRSSISLYAAGMTPAGGLRFPRDVAVFPLGPEGSGIRDRLVLDLTEAQRFSAGVIQARSPTNIEQIASRSARERLTFTREGDRTTVVNGLGATIAALFYREGNTIYSLVDGVPPGGKATLQAGTRNASTVVPMDLPLSTRFLHLVQNQPAGSYLAVLDRSPFLEPGVSNVAERGSFHLVLGWPGGQP